MMTRHIRPFEIHRSLLNRIFVLILSFHPNIVAHENIICAGRLPNEEDLAAVRRVQAVVLPHGCSRALHLMCEENCAHVFPNYRVRFSHPGKLGQARLFQETGTPFPHTYLFDAVSTYYGRYGTKLGDFPLDFPCVFKSDMGGEGEGVFLLRSPDDLFERLHKAAIAEKSGQKGFLLQEYVSCGDRTLRVVVVGEEFRSYWRIQQDASRFVTSINAGAFIDHDSDPEIRKRGIEAVREFCLKTGVNLAGFDLLFARGGKDPVPLFLEINYFFGRRGLGGFHEYYKLVEKEVDAWLGRLGLRRALLPP